MLNFKKIYFFIFFGTLSQTACTTSQSMRIPQGYAKFTPTKADIQGYYKGDEELFNILRPKESVKFINPDGVVLRRSSVRLDDASDADFWREALVTKLTKQGYQIKSKGDSIAKNIKGSYVQFTHHKHGLDLIYSVHFFVKGNDVFTLEAGGSADHMKKEDKKIQRAINTWNL